jgi:hypothetical protein
MDKSLVAPKPGDNLVLKIYIINYTIKFSIRLEKTERNYFST